MRKGKTIFYVAPIKRLLRKEKIKIRKNALTYLIKKIEEYTTKLAKRSEIFAKENKRKIVKKRDIEEAIKERILKFK